MQRASSWPDYRQTPDFQIRLNEINLRDLLQPYMTHIFPVHTHTHTAQNSPDENRPLGTSSVIHLFRDELQKKKIND